MMAAIICGIIWTVIGGLFGFAVDTNAPPTWRSIWKNMVVCGILFGPVVMAFCLIRVAAANFTKNWTNE